MGLVRAGGGSCRRGRLGAGVPLPAAPGHPAQPSAHLLAGGPGWRLPRRARRSGRGKASLRPSRPPAPLPRKRRGGQARGPSFPGPSLTLDRAGLGRLGKLRRGAARLPAARGRPRHSRLGRLLSVPPPCRPWGRRWGSSHPAGRGVGTYGAPSWADAGTGVLAPSSPKLHRENLKPRSCSIMRRNPYFIYLILLTPCRRRGLYLFCFLHN